MMTARGFKPLWLLGLLVCLHSPSLLAQVPRAAPEMATRSVPSIMESTRAKVLAALARGDIAGAIAAYETHLGRRAPEWLRALQTAYSTQSQEVGRCQQVARTIHTAYSKLDKAPEFIAIQANNKRQFMTFDMPDGRSSSVTRNGYHAAVKVGDMIYDAFTGPLGLKMADYFTRLNAPEGHSWKVVGSP